MLWHRIALRRPVMAVMLSCVVLLFGYIAYQRIGLDRFPEVEFPLLTITVSLPGADPETMASSVAQPIESAINRIPGVLVIRSSSTPTVSVVFVEFDLEKDLDKAFNEVQAEMSRVLSSLPQGIEPPLVSKVQVGEQPVAWLVLSGDRDLPELNTYADEIIKPALQVIRGVGSVQIAGQRKPMMRVALQPHRMRAHGVVVSDVLAAFAREHIQLPGGFLTRASGEDLLNLNLEFQDAGSLSTLVVRADAAQTVRLGDVADVQEGIADFRQWAEHKGQPALGLGVVKIRGENTVSVVRAVRERLEDVIRPRLSPGMHIDLVFEEASLVESIVAGLWEHIVWGTLLAAGVVFFFLKDARATLIIATAIPIALLGAVAIMYGCGYTFNLLTLMGLLLLIGVVVDDAIVVLESIYRHQEMGLASDQAALKGTDKVVFAVWAATITLACVFVPVALIGGVLGRFLSSLGVVVASGVLVSMAVSFTLTPVLCAVWLRNRAPGRVDAVLDPVHRTMDRGYRRALDWALGHRKQVMVWALLSVVGSAVVMSHIQKSFVPPDDESQFLVFYKTPLGSSLSYTQARMQALLKVLDTFPEVDDVFARLGEGEQGQVHQGVLSIKLVPVHERERSQRELMSAVNRAMHEVPGVQAYPSPFGRIGQLRGEPLQWVIKGPDLHELFDLSSSVQRELNSMEGVGPVDLDLQLTLPQQRVILDRVRAATLGVDVRDVANTVGLMVAGQKVGAYRNPAHSFERHDVQFKAQQGRMTEPSDLAKLYVRNRSGHLVRADAVARLEPMLGPAQVFRQDLQYAAMFFADPSVAMGEAMVHVKRVLQSTLPPGYAMDWEGQAKEFVKTQAYVQFALTMMLILVYMVLASQFNSFTQPLVVMLAQPLAWVGGLTLLWITGHTLNIYSTIGLLLLMGLVAKNSILLVDLTNQLRAQGMPLEEALKTACPERMRPVLMTSMTVVLAMLPAAWGQGSGTAANAPLAVAVIGGMLSSTVLTLVVIPVGYALLMEILAADRAAVWQRVRRRLWGGPLS